MPLAHPFYFLVAKRDASRDVRPFQVRDAMANQQIVEALRPLGFELGEARINNPPPAEQKVDPTQLARVDTDDCGPEDVIVTTTRWPVSDEEHDARKRLPRAYTDLEQELLDVWKGYLPVLGRVRVRLLPEHHALLPRGFENRFDMRFREREGAPYLTLQGYHDKRRQPYQGNEERTAAFLLRLPQLPHRNTGYVGAWSPDGISTLVWTHLIRHRHADLLREPGFVMAELVSTPIPERPTDYRWTLDWRAEILFRVPLDAPQQKRREKPATDRSRSEAA